MHLNMSFVVSKLNTHKKDSSPNVIMDETLQFLMEMWMWGILEMDNFENG
jgi:hypothetical protein